MGDDPNFFTGDTPLSGRYVVALVLSDSAASASSAPAKGTATNSSISMPVMEPYQEDYPDTDQRAANLCATYGGNPSETFTHTATFVSDTMTEAEARAMSNDPEVLSVSEDFALHADTATITPAGMPEQWGLDQIDDRSPTRSNTYSYTNTRAGVHAYVMDTGIRVDMPEFEGRASLDFSAVNGETPADDPTVVGIYKGHGTAVASIIGGRQCGVARGCRLHAVKVQDRAGHIYVSAVVKACDWVKAHRQLPAVVNMSFGGPTGRNLFGSSNGPQDTAARRLADSGVTVVCSAGNENVDASQTTPANVNELIVVGACDIDLQRANFGNGQQSNYGNRIDLFAPGDHVSAIDILSYDTPTGKSGSSFAAPFVAGVAAQYLQSHPTANHYAVQNWLRANATQDKLNATDLRSVNKFLFTDQ